MPIAQPLVQRDAWDKTRERTWDRTWLTGVILIACSLFFFCYPSLFTHASTDQMGMFLMNYLFVILYFIILAASGRLKKGEDGLAPLFLFLVLFLISAY